MPKRIFTKKISIFQALVACFVICCASYFILQNKFENKITADNDDSATQSKLRIIRDKSFQYARPLRYFDIENPSSQLIPIREEIKKIIASHNSAGDLTNASIYLRNLETGEWTSINEDQTYHPGSLFKVPMLMYYLKQAEKNPSILDTRLKIADDQNTIPAQTFNDKALTKGESYTVRELLKYMVSYSDNNATFQLNNYCNIPEFNKMFTDLNLPVPDVHNINYTISIKDYSIFLRTLYNATYLTPESSDYALNLLTQSSFNKGITEKLPSQIKVARKFGEMYDGTYKELHECGIIYCSNKPYMLTIMTKGYNSVNLATVLSSISDTIFKYFCV
jgi:beta-lactamase class A